MSGATLGATGRGVRGPYVLIGAVCLAAVAAALVAQYVYDMQPCPWCILQRILFVAIALVAFVAAAVGLRPVRALGSLLIAVLAGCGIAAALYQHNVAAQSVSCNLTFADKVITALKADAIFPALFQVTASCADAAVSILGVPFEFYSLGLYAVLGVVALALLRR